MSKTVLFQTIQFSITTQFNLIWLIDKILSLTTTPGQSGPVSYSNKEVLSIPQSSIITGTSTSDCLVSYQGLSLEKYCPSAEMQFVSSGASADWARVYWKRTSSNETNKKWRPYERNWISSNSNTKQRHKD